MSRDETKEETLEVAQHLLSAIQTLKDLLSKDSVIGYNLLIQMQRPTGVTYNIVQYDAIDVTKLIGASHLAIRDLEIQALDGIRNGIPSEDEDEDLDYPDFPKPGDETAIQ